MTSRTFTYLSWARRKVSGLIVLGVCGVVPLLAGAQSAPRTDSQAYRLPRYDEDWSFLRAYPEKTDWIDPIKFIPLDDRGEAYLSLGGEARETYERFHNPNFGLQPQDPGGYLLQRYLVHADVHTNPHTRFFVEMVSALENWRVGGPRPVIDEDKLDFHQGFFELRAYDSDNRGGMIRLGRQELTLGSGRLLALREGTNVPSAFDGVRASLGKRGLAVDIFATKPVSTKAGIADDPPQAGNWFWGFYLSRDAHKAGVRAPVPGFDVYYFGLDRNPAFFNEGVGHERRHTVGVRAWNLEGSWNYDVEAMLQFGTFGNAGIHAFRIASDTSYFFRGVTWHPRLSFAVDVASGDHDSNRSTLQTFNALFQSGTYSGRAQILGPANTIRLEPSVSVAPVKSVSVSSGWGFYWREDIHDGLYGIAGNLLVPGNAAEARYEGSRPIFQIDWQVDRHFSVHANYIYVFNGPFGQQAIHGTSGMSYVSPWVSYRF